MRIRSAVTRTPSPESAVAADHFQALLGFETDCWDVHHALTHDLIDFVLLDVRSPEMFAQGHLPGATNLPGLKIKEGALADWGRDTQFVVYCNGPHCNGADKAALRLSRLDRRVKKMIGGVEGWKDEGFELVA